MINTCLIYCRLDSKRLKNKALKKIFNNQNLIECVIQNVLQINSIKKIILLTTKNKEDIKLNYLKRKFKIDIFRGSTNNLIKRSIDCSKIYKFDYFLRVCGDRPFFVSKKINQFIKAINNKKKLNYDLITNNSQKYKVDQGLTIEIVSIKSLKKIIKKFKLNKRNKEHMTSFYYENYKKFKILKLYSPKSWFLKNKYTIDNSNDLKRIKSIFNEENSTKLTLTKMIKLYKL